MYRCQDCDYQFLYADSLVDRHNLENPPFEKIAVCPNCKGRNFSEIKKHYCKYCGRSLKKDVTEYCSDYCRKKGEKMWQEQAVRKNLYNQNSLVSITRELEEYNKKHKTNYTYGTFVSKVLSKKQKETKKQ